LELFGISYEFLKLEWRRALKPPTFLNVFVNSYKDEKATCTNSQHLRRWVVLRAQADFDPPTLLSLTNTEKSGLIDHDCPNSTEIQI